MNIDYPQTSGEREISSSRDPRLNSSESGVNKMENIGKLELSKYMYQLSSDMHILKTMHIYLFIYLLLLSRNRWIKRQSE